ncbi:MAG TPA: hypothetical protein VNA14_07745 [Mycobacteriales bacterium]|nr:hypothetical protein [Mycobacteriales bacterium]
MSAEAFTAVVRTYADRVHDDVRRLGATPAEAAEIVESSALDVLDDIAADGADVSGAVGRWFAQARVLACRLVDADAQPRAPDPDAAAAAPEGLIRDTALDLAARRGLAQLSSRDRAALLLRDAYELPESSTAAALALDLSAARALVTAARRRFAEVTEGTTAAEVPLLLRGLAILSLPDEERDAILVRVARAADAALPPESDLVAIDDDLGAHGPSVTTIAVSVVGAVLLGALFGAITAPEPGRPATNAIGELPPTVEPFDVRKVDPAFATPTATPSPTPRPSPSASPSSTATATAAPSPTATAQTTSTAITGSPTITLSPASGPDCTSVRVAGRSFVPGAAVEVAYSDPLGRPTPSGGAAVVDSDGRFSLRFAACDPNRLPGPHRVVARSQDRSAAATFTATS